MVGGSENSLRRACFQIDEAKVFRCDPANQMLFFRVFDSKEKALKFSASFKVFSVISKQVFCGILQKFHRIMYEMSSQ